MTDRRTLEIRHLADLLSMHFHIPSYQRGYRWERKHVEALLNDLSEFSRQAARPSGAQGRFYCMQPLAVVKNHRLSSEEKTVYDVIDGQQRLTTLYLLLSYLEAARPHLYSGPLATALFSLQYESRDSDFFDRKEFKSGNPHEALRNIDFFYMARAYQAIHQWFERTGTSKAKILRVLIPENYQPTEGLDGPQLEDVRNSNDKESDVRFIWYEVPVNEHTDSMDVFSQLNYGKTALTATELVKALLLQCDIYTTDRPLMQEVCFRRSCEWDGMEKQLQDPFMWGMFMSGREVLPSHITIVLDMVCHGLYTELKEANPEWQVQEGSPDFIYLVCDRYLEDAHDKDYADKAGALWQRILHVYTSLLNWYRNPDTYHLIGLLVWLKEYKSKKFGPTARLALLKELMRQYSQGTKPEFIGHLKQQIAHILHVEDAKNTREGTMPWGLRHINYNENPLQVVRILVAFNVEEVRKQQADSARFPFHLLRELNITSLEHIHPQHLELDNINLDTLRSWLDEKREALRQLGKSQEYASDVARLKLCFTDADTYKQHHDEAQALIAHIDKEFDDLAAMSEAQMHTLYNLALVDKDTNSALSNCLLDQKRCILKRRHESKESYVLPCTFKAFGKYYTRPSQADITSKLWTTQDREDYFRAIEKVYKDFDSYHNTKQ